MSKDSPTYAGPCEHCGGALHIEDCECDQCPHCGKDTGQEKCGVVPRDPADEDGSGSPPQTVVEQWRANDPEFARMMDEEEIKLNAEYAEEDARQRPTTTKEQ